MKLYRVMFGSFLDCGEIIKECPKSYKVKSWHGSFGSIFKKDHVYAGVGTSTFNTEKTFNNKRDCCAFARKQIESQIDFYQRKIDGLKTESMKIDEFEQDETK